MSKIMVIDDTDDVRSSICKILKKSGNDVIEASDGEEAIKTLKDNKCDLLILDIVMPKKSGIQVLFEINKIYPEIKVIFITGKVPEDSDAFKIFSSSFGVKDIIYKPFKKDALLNCVSECLNR
jgi:DNA-binding response OmpR family regulator